MQNIKAFLNSLPHQPGVYQMLGAKSKVLYIGKARNLKKRLASYFSKQTQDTKTRSLLKHVEDIQVTVTYSENEALLLECNLIKKHQPHYNILFRDDKSYPYILLTEETFPRIDFYRGNRKTKGRYFGPYPNTTAVRETIHLIEKLFHIRTCTDSFYASRTRPCLQHQIARCSAPCGALISEEDYQRNVQHTILFLEGKNTLLFDELQKQMERAVQDLNFELAARIRDQIARLRQIQERQYISGGEANTDVLSFAYSSGVACIVLLSIRGGRILGSRAYFPTMPAGSLPEEIMASFITQHYLSAKTTMDIPRDIIFNVKLPEQALLASVLSESARHKVLLAHNVRGERKKWLEMAETTAKQSVVTRLVSKVNIQARFKTLQTVLHLKNLPNRIECFDISHSMGEEAVASCVVFTIQGPAKSDYRRFNITGITPGDDFAAMRQVIMRRFKRLQKENSVMPDLVLIDGGKPQLHAAMQVLAEIDVTDVLLIGVAKGPDRKPGFETLYQPDDSAIHLPKDSLALHLIQQIRDEAHRFAITGHRERRDKKRVTSILETIPGIGAKRRRELLKHFGGMQSLKLASLEELAKVPGISQSLADLIYSALNKG